MTLFAGLYFCNECKADAHSRSGAILVLSLAKDDPGFVDEDKAARVDPVASNAIERLHEELKRRIKTQTVLPSAETAAMLFWALLAWIIITSRYAKNSIGPLKPSAWQSPEQQAAASSARFPNLSRTSGDLWV